MRKSKELQQRRVPRYRREKALLKISRLIGANAPPGNSNGATPSPPAGTADPIDRIPDNRDENTVPIVERIFFEYDHEQSL
ncbi:hypothetical protein ACXIUT_01355 [Achromobacter denitrificans]